MGCALSAAVLTAVIPRVAHACATCFGDPNSGLVKGAKAGVIVLAVVAYGVVLTMAGVAGFWAFRARKLAARRLDDPATDVHDDRSS